MTSIYEKAVAVICKPPEARRDFEVQPLVSWFQKRSQLFQAIKQEWLKDIVKNCRFVQKAKDDIVIRQGEKGDCFYIILRGEIAIYNKDDAEKEEGGKAPVMPGIYNFPDRSKLGNFVCPLGPGANFGDVALVTGDALRTASIVANETTDFIEVTAELYKRYVRDVLAKDYEQRTSFIQDNPLFSSWGPKYRKQLAMALYKEEFPYEATLVKQGEPVTNIYFIISGQVEIRIDSDMHAQQYPKLFSTEDGKNNQNDRISDKKKVSNELPHVTASKRREAHVRSVNVCLLGQYGCVGDTEMLMEMDTYLQTAKCVAKTEVLVLEMKHYDRLFVKRHTKTIDSMKSILEVRLNNRLSISPNDLPLLQNIVTKLKENTSLTNSKEDSKKGLTYADAEREFRNHRGPLIDLYGPGSVFHAIRIREKTRTKMKLHQQKYTSSASSFGNQMSQQTKENVDNAFSMLPKKQISDLESYYAMAPVYDVSTLCGAHRLEYTPVAKEFRQGNKVMNASAEDEVALTHLEERIRLWFTRSDSASPNPVRTFRRLVVEDVDNMPKQGHKVVVRKRWNRIASPELGLIKHFKTLPQIIISH